MTRIAVQRQLLGDERRDGRFAQLMQQCIEEQAEALGTQRRIAKALDAVDHDARRAGLLDGGERFRGDFIDREFDRRLPKHHQTTVLPRIGKRDRHRFGLADESLRTLVEAEIHATLAACETGREELQAQQGLADARRADQRGRCALREAAAEQVVQVQQAEAEPCFQIDGARLLRELRFEAREHQQPAAGNAEEVLAHQMIARAHLVHFYFARAPHALPVRASCAAASTASAASRSSSACR